MSDSVLGMWGGGRGTSVCRFGCGSGDTTLWDFEKGSTVLFSSAQFGLVPFGLEVTSALTYPSLRSEN